MENIEKKPWGNWSIGQLLVAGVVALVVLFVLVGTGAAVVDQLGALYEAGVQRVMLQWLDLDDLDGLEALAQAVLSKD